MAADRRQILVCINCRSRKKKCDKRLPSCGYCIKKHLTCSYGRDPRSRRWSPDTTRQDSSPSTQGTDSGANFSIPAPSITFATISATPGALETSVYLEVNRLIRSTGQFVDDITARYFKDVHIFIPVIARPRFHTNLITLGATPSADLSILLLCMCLITPDPEVTNTDLRGSANRHITHLSARSIFAQLQALISPSVHFIQAGLLLAVYDYVHGESDRGLAAIANSARMAYTARIHSLGVGLGYQGPVGDCPQPEELEASNTWWGLVIWERIMMWEATSRDQPLVTSAPTEDMVLPTEPELIDQGDPVSLSTVVPRVLVSTSHEVNVCGFARIAQAIKLADQILRAFSIREPEARLSLLRDLSAPLQSFLEVVMKQHSGRLSSYCAAVTVAIRSLFGLHEHIVALISADISNGGSTERFENGTENSLIALRTGIAMTLDIAEWHEGMLPRQSPGLPPNYRHMICAALYQMENSTLFEDELWVHDTKEKLGRSLVRFGRLWDLAKP